MPELKVERDRYDGRVTLPFIRADLVTPHPRQPYIETPLGDDDEFAICFDVAGAGVDEALLDRARSLMLRIGHLDNSVQESCAMECRRTGLHPRNFEGSLAFVTLTRRGALLRYFGTGVNTEWDEVAEMRDGAWEHVGPATPDLSSRGA